MPRAPMDKEAVSEKKEQILDIAADIIMEDGYQNLSMRKIGAKIGMTAANLYNYFANKDELNIAIRMRAGKILYTDLVQAYESGRDISEKIGLMAEAYMKFGLLKPNYYSIMFDMSTPKHADYIDSPLEPLARKEKESSEKSLELLVKCTGDFADEGYQVPDNHSLIMIMIWSQLHGLVSLYNNKLLSEVNEAPDETIREATRLAHTIFFSFFGEKALS